MGKLLNCFVMDASQIEQKLQSVLEKTFGFDAFRPGQKEAIVSLLNSGKVLCIQPTGHGKSLLYQLTSCLVGGVTIVISPLLALMRDQIDHLNNRFKIPAASINSDQSEEENEDARQKASAGKVQVLFVAPEQLDHVDRFAFLLGLDVRLVVVDEAHCISTWGHDFRPSYRQILNFVKALHEKNSQVKILGLTATADDRVEKDIVNQLGFTGEVIEVLRETMNRPNIQLSAMKCQGIPHKLALCEQLLSKLEGCGLIYCATRDNCELVAEYLQSRGVSIKAYHAGFEQEEKRVLQKEFTSDKYKALAATNALGMGIDKGNLRFIIHFDIPGSITAYYQEVGRSGRDGKKAQGILLYDPGDRRVQQYFIDSSQPRAEDFTLVLDFVKTSPEAPNLQSIKRATGLHPTRVTIVVADLIEQKFLTKFSNKGSQVYQALENELTPDLARYSQQYEVKSRELHNMLEYAEQKGSCRMAWLRKILGDQEAEACSHCDSCLGEATSSSISDQKIAEVSQWMEGRAAPIASSATYKISSGVSILDGTMRTPLFVNFMRNRADTLAIEDELITLLKMHLNSLSKEHHIAGIVPLPSRTWRARDQVAALLSEHLGVPLLADLLSWSEMPLKRQGELLNNDQRHFNVLKKMQANWPSLMPAGALILLDDYIGSGNTIKEAGRALRANKTFTAPLIPFTIASVKWHLGKTGFV